MSFPIPTANAELHMLDRDRAAARARFDANDPAGAREAYLALLARAPDDPDVLADAGTFFFKTGAYAAAGTIFERCLQLVPSARAYVNRANVAFACNDYEAARAGYAMALTFDPDCAAAHEGLSYALVRLDREADAAVHRRRGLAGRSVRTAAFRGTGRPVDVLLLAAAAGGTIYTDALLDDTVFRVTTLIADADDPAPPALPRVDVVFNAIADADRVPDALRLVDARFGADPRLVNAPRAVLATTREGNAQRLAALPDVRAPRCVRLSRATVRQSPDVVAALGFAYPVLFRSPGYHTGTHFVRVDEAAALADALAALPGDDVLAIAFVDLRDRDGAIRKYRMMAVDGRLYPLHAAIGRAWKLHFVTADMDEPAHRAEDARFLADPDAVLGARARRALERIVATLGLDYMGIDFGLDADGRVVVFEANATMIVLPPPTDPVWAYRRGPVDTIIGAVRRMVLARRNPIPAAE